MTKHGIRLVSGVKELIHTEGTTLEDLHMVAVEVVLSIDKVAARTVRKLKEGQKIRCYVETSNKEYGAKGSDTICYYRGSYDTQTYGTKLKVYEADKEWVIGIDCLLEVYEDFDPESVIGKKLVASLPGASTGKKKRRGRKSNKEKRALAAQEALDMQEDWSYRNQGYEPLDIDFENYDGEYYDE